MRKYLHVSLAPLLLLTLFLGVLLTGNSYAAVVTLNPTDDTYIDQYTPTDINGTKSHLIVRRGGTGYILSTLLKFDFSSIPPGTNVNSAKLYLNYYHYNDGNPSGKNLTVHQITGAWSETTTNWNNRPTYNTTPFASQTMPGSYQWVEWDVTGEVQNIINGSPHLGWEVIDPSTGGYFSMIYFRAKEYGQDIPYLEIDTGLATGWYWKPAHPNYAPSGMPDFDMKQDTWKSIFPGPNGTIESAVSGDDVYNSTDAMIAPGPNGQLETTPVGDDYADWSFSGPAALANCFWWFDSKFGDPGGYPGDGLDDFPLVEGYYATEKQVDQEQPIYDAFADLFNFPPGHIQEFVPTVPILDAVQILLKFNYPNEPTTIEVSIYNALPSSPAVTPLGTSIRTITGPWEPATWFQFHFEPAIPLTPFTTYYIAVRVLSGDGNPLWCYTTTNPYLPGIAWFNYDNYVLVPQDETDFAFRTEYYDSRLLDDHEADNAPYLIEDLADYIQTNALGYSDIDLMQEAIDQWLVDKGLDGNFVESTYVEPEFEFIEGEIERSQDVILLLGFYGGKLIDQQQTNWDYRVDLYPWMPGHLQEFTPTVSVLDAVQLLLMADDETPTNVEVSIYNTLPSSSAVTPIGVTSMVVSVPWYPAWYQFHFEPAVPLSVGGLYYIAVRTLDVQNNVEWCYATDDYYPGGDAWMNWDDYYLQQEPFQDFGFKTEYYEVDSTQRRGQQYVTCAGVNSDFFQIAFSDPMYDIRGGAMGAIADHTPHPFDATVHNDAQYVSHDIYNVTIGPIPGISGIWWLPDYPSGYKFTVVEKAVVICPTEDCDCDPGDCNGDGTYNILDITCLISFLYQSGPAPTPYALCSGDASCDCTINILDITYLISFLYQSGPAPCTCQQWLINCGPPLRK